MNKPELLLTGPAFLRTDDDGITRLYETIESYTGKMNTMAHNIATSAMKGEISRPTKVLTIPRGGLAPSEFVARTLGLTAEHVVSFGARSYTGEARRGSLVMGQMPPREQVEDQIIIIPEDVADTGETLDAVENILWGLGAKEVLTAAVYWKRQSEEPDFYVEATDEPDRWVVFPTTPNDEYSDFFKAQMELPVNQRMINQATILG